MTKRDRGRPKRSDKDNNNVKSSEKGTKPGDRRKTYIVNTEIADKIDEISHQERVPIKEVVNDAFLSHINKWEKKNGPLKPPPLKS